MSIIGPGIQIFTSSSGGGGGGNVTANGIIGDGSAGSPVRLGGSFTHFTSIFAPSGTGLEIASEDANGNFSHLDIGAGQTTMDANNQGDLPLDPVTAFIGAYNGAGSVFSRMTNGSNNGNVQGLVFQDTQTGMVFDETNSIGLEGEIVYPPVNDEQYAQYGNIQIRSEQIYAATGQSSSTNIVTYNVPVSDSVIRNSTTLFLLVSAGLGIDVNITWTDPAGSVKTELVCSGGGLGNFPAETQTFYCQGGSVISIDTLVSGANVYDVFGIFEVVI